MSLPYNAKLRLAQLWAAIPQNDRALLGNDVTEVTFKGFMIACMALLPREENGLFVLEADVDEFVIGTLMQLDCEPSDYVEQLNSM